MRMNPVHQRTREGVYWTTVNATEAIPGTTTPLTWSYYDDATELALRETFALIGVLRTGDVALPADTDERFIGIFHGHPAANLNRFRLMADLAPGGSGDALEQQFFGTLMSGVQPHLSRGRYPFVAARSPWVMQQAPHRVHALHGEAHRWWQTAAVAAPDAARDRRLLREGADLYRRVLVWHGAATMLTQGLYDQLGRLCAAAGLAGTEVTLVGGLEGVEESRTLDDIWAYSRGDLGRETVIARHGFHGRDEGELRTTVWRERPELVDTLAAAFRRMEIDHSPAAKNARAAAAARVAAERLVTASKARDRVKARLVLALTRRLMPLREAGRGGLVRALDGTRAAARRIGEQAVADGGLEQVDDVFFLTIEELCAGPEGGCRDLVAERRARHDEYVHTRLPEGWRGDPEPIVIADEDDQGADLEGVAASAGRFEGVARVIESADDEDELAPGEILVCKTTDPGWAPLMQTASALVIAVGGPLSHGAIVARELGLPCVIGVRNATSAIRTGDRISVDGTTGRVQILERSPTTA
jgi:pyruvate,water dikinase